MLLECLGSGCIQTWLGWAKIRVELKNSRVDMRLWEVHKTYTSSDQYYKKKNFLDLLNIRYI